MKKLNSLFLASLVTLLCSSCSKHTVFKPTFKKFGSIVSEETFLNSINSVRSDYQARMFYSSNNIYIQNLVKNASITYRSSTVCKSEKLGTNEISYSYSENEINSLVDSINKRYKSHRVNKSCLVGYYENDKYVNKTKNEATEDDAYGEIRGSQFFSVYLNNKTYQTYSDTGYYYTSACLRTASSYFVELFSLREKSSESRSVTCYVNKKTFTQIIKDAENDYTVQYSYEKNNIKATVKHTTNRVQNSIYDIGTQVKNSYVSYYQIIVKSTASTVKAVDYSTYRLAN